MRITRQIAADRLGAYLRQELPQEGLVDWAERQMMDGDFESNAVRDVVARLGVADVSRIPLRRSLACGITSCIGSGCHVSVWFVKSTSSPPCTHAAALAGIGPIGEGATVPNRRQFHHRET